MDMLSYLKPYKQAGDEVIPDLCPFCKGGEHRDKNTFAYNVRSGLYNCKRGTCNRSGNAKDLRAHFGIRDGMEIFVPSKKTFVKPKAVLQQAMGEVEVYLQRRGISKETWESRGVGSSGGKITFPYHDETGELVMVKFREPKKGGKWIREPGGKPVFWGMDQCKEPYIIITEGEFDALAVIEAGDPQVVSMPSGAGDITCLEHCWTWLESKSKVIIWPDQDQPGQDLCRKLIARLGEHRCYVITAELTEGCKDANEVLYKLGKEKVLSCIAAAVEVPVSGLIRVADIKPFDLRTAERTRSGIPALDKILGGFFYGGVSVWTGENGSGKSTLLGQVAMIEPIDQGLGVCVFSGELPAPFFRYWVELQMAGPDNLEKQFDAVRQEDMFFVRHETLGRIREWYRDLFFLYDSYGTSQEEDILRVFEYAARKYNCKVFVIDNLMVTALDQGTEKDFYRAQGAFIGRLNDFAKRYECHVHIVAHPRKTTGRVQKYDIAGSGEITNRADNVLAMVRQQGDTARDARIEVFKNRILGKQDVSIGLKFDPRCKRFYPANQPDLREKKYSWEADCETN